MYMLCTYLQFFGSKDINIVVENQTREWDFSRNCLRCAHPMQAERPLAINNNHSSPKEFALHEPTFGSLHKNSGQCLAVAILDGSINLILTCAVLQIKDKQPEILVLLAYHALHITVHRHITIVIK